MKKLTPKQIEAQIKRNNAKFKKASAAQKRVLIAKDVLARLASKQYTPMTSYYVAGALLDHTQIQPAVVAGAACKVCGIGSLLISCTVFNNSQTSGDLSTDMGSMEGLRYGREVSLSNGLHEIFKPEQLKLIEECFMGWGWSEDQPPKFYSAHRALHERLAAIMQNIIANKGTFKP